MTRLARLATVLLIGVAALCCSPSRARDTAAVVTPQLTAKGLAAVRLGMSIAIAERALHAKLSRLSRSSHGFASEPESSESCWLWRRRDGQNSNISYMTERGRIVRIDVSASTTAAASTLTTRGIGVGSALSDVEKAYGADLQLEPHPLEEGTQWAVVERAGTAGVRIEVRGGAVSAMFTAEGAALDYSEGCS